MPNTLWGRGVPPMRYGQADTEDETAGSYVVEPIEYVRASPLPANGLFDNSDRVSDLVERTKSSIKSRSAEHLRQIISELEEAIGQAAKDGN
jgi:hypothetical protein